MALLSDIAGIDFTLVNRLIRQWVLSKPSPEISNRIEPIPVIPRATMDQPDAREAWDAGEEALRAGQVGLLMVAGGQGTRLHFVPPKGTYSIGPVSRKSFFAFHAEKIHNLRRRYGCRLPWYIMVSPINHAATQAFFQEHDFFGLSSEDVWFFEQGMMPCVDGQGRLLLEDTYRLAMNPNGHGGCIDALVTEGITTDAGERGIRILSYVQVDNWAVKVADPFFIGYHVLRKADMSSKVHRKAHPREAVGVHCLCNGEYRVIEYSELDLNPQLLQTDAHDRPIHFAGNPAIHILSVDFVGYVKEKYDTFPWHCVHKKVPYLDESGTLIHPTRPNGYKFETFVFDALRFIRHEPVALDIARPGEYTPIKQLDGDNSVEAAWRVMGNYWGEWLDAAGYPVPRDASGDVAIKLEISPEFALCKEEFVRNSAGRTWPTSADLAIGPKGTLLSPPSA
jgi:UDP-N-acetylglucosamine/UDP-N-acetylgalactosamine diphosphorylase